MNTSIAYIAAVQLALLLAGCAGQATTDGAAQAMDNTCVNVRRVSGFNPLSNRELLVTTVGREYYLVTLGGICQGLRTSESIAFDEATGRICGNGIGKVVFNDSTFGRQSCYIDDIEQLTSAEEAREIVDARRKARYENR